MAVVFPLLKSLPIKEQKKIIGSLSQINVPKGTFIFERGDMTSDVYFILSGAVKSLNYGDNGKLAYFKTRREGDFFGHYSAITNSPRSANMVTVEQTKLAKMKQEDFMSLITTNPSIAGYFMKLIGDLLRQETFRVNNIITMDSKERLIHDLLLQNKKNKIFISTREEYASYLNMTRETLSRHLNLLSKNKIISINRGFIEIINLKKLSKEIL